MVSGDTHLCSFEKAQKYGYVRGEFLNNYAGIAKLSQEIVKLLEDIKCIDEKFFK